MRKKIVAANWKMNMTLAESRRFIESFLLDASDIRDVEIVIIPPFTALGEVTQLLEKSGQSIKVAARRHGRDCKSPYDIVNRHLPRVFNQLQYFSAASFGQNKKAAAREGRRRTGL